MCSMMSKILGISLIGICLQAHAIEAYGEQAKQIKISGEQLIHDVPKGWELAYFQGDPAGNFVTEYVPKGDDVRQWKQGYLLIERINYPDSTILKQLKTVNTSVSQAGVMATQETAKEGCGGKFVPMSEGAITFNQMPAYVSGGFCSQYGRLAPFGEGAVVSVVEGKQYLFKMQYSWRPQSAQTQYKWGLDTSQISNYLNRMKNTKLCGGDNEPKCNN